MRPWTAWTLALLLAGLPALPVGAAPNREPVADAGLDRWYAESTAPPWSAANNPQSEGTLDGTRSYDPDAAAEGAEVLNFGYRTTPPACTPPSGPCPSPPFTDIGSSPSVASTTPGPQCPNLVLAKGADKGSVVFKIPNIPAGPQRQCVYSIDMQVRDAPGGTDEDTVVVTILNDNQPPKSNLVRPISVLLGDTYGSGAVRTDVDIQGDHGKILTLRASELTDDKVVKSAQLRFCRPDCTDPVFRQDVPLVDKFITAKDPEVAQWSAALPVDTPWLVVGDYVLELLVHDGEGGTMHIGGDSTGVASLTVSAIQAGQCIAPGQADPSPGPCLLLENITPVQGQATNLCFPGTTSQPPQALGIGQTLRPLVEAFLPDPEAYTTGVGGAAEITDSRLMFWKLTYQTCAGLRDSPSGVALGPEIEVRYPYFLSLDTLFKGDQEIMLRAYDRYDNPPTALVVPLTTDTATPEYMLDVPAVTYRGIPFKAVAYVHDRIETQVTFSIDIFNRSATGKAIALVNQTRLSDDDTPHTQSLLLPPLHRAVKADLWGSGNAKAPCQYLYDLDGTGGLDFWYDPRNHTSGLLVGVEGRRDADPTDYVMDADRDGLAEPGERLIPGAVPGPLRDMGKCASPFAPPFMEATRGRDLEAFLNTTDGLGTQVFLFHANRTHLGKTSWSFAVEDVVFNREAQPRYVFQYKVGDKSYESPQNLTGALTTEQAYVDAGIQEFRVEPKPYLPGDPIVLNVTMVQRSPLVPGPEVPLTLRLSDPSFAAFTSPPLGPGDTHKLTLARPYAKGVIKGDLTFDQVNEMMQGYGPGIHVLRGNVTVPAYVEERGSANNTASTRFEVFLGKVVVGTLAAGDKATGEVFYIRAGDRDLPAEAVRLDSQMKVVESHSLRLDQSFGSPRYAFTFLREGVPVDAYWDPQSRYDVANGHLCNQQQAGDVTPKCRSVTVVGESAAEVDVESPHLELLGMVVVLLGVALLASRRRTA